MDWETFLNLLEGAGFDSFGDFITTTDGELDELQDTGSVAVIIGEKEYVISLTIKET